ncbi:secondary thiamine-phosphate synthase enzyme YjbQ [Candidatus Hecatella orcuttiae]|uniref:secondary thiamine-phosphate synthase enzyme YjbQ n=1 Tax=Candidatus Hecatella orcuttiae TaxID=1935119 RepID=UPI00286839E6|nr:secondary thiamine-phosphate synthase enzyme YjbQ [Candidatus Hecatella orcuttiae]
MKTVFTEFTVSTTKKVELVNITRRVEEAAEASGVRNGLCLVYVPHSTAALIANENEAGLIQDILNKVEGFFSPGAGYRHDLVDDNAHAHLASVFLGFSQVFPLRNSKIARGVWQSIFLLDLDGPRSRRVTVEVLGE